MNRNKFLAVWPRSVLEGFFFPLHILLSLVFFQSVLGESNGPTADQTQRKMNRNKFNPKNPIRGDLLGD